MFSLPTKASHIYLEQTNMDIKSKKYPKKDNMSTIDFQEKKK